MIITIDDRAVLLRAVGEAVTRDTKARFQSATAPDGTRWQPNARATIEAYIREKGGVSAKTGKITARGQECANWGQPPICLIVAWRRHRLR